MQRRGFPLSSLSSLVRIGVMIGLYSNPVSSKVERKLMRKDGLFFRIESKILSDVSEVIP